MRRQSAPRPFIRATMRCTACRFVATLGRITLDGTVDANAPAAFVDQFADMGDGFLLHIDDGPHVPMLEPALVVIP